MDVGEYRPHAREVFDLLTTVVFPAIGFDRPADASYDDEELLLLVTLLGVTGTAAGEWPLSAGHSALDPPVTPRSAAGPCIGSMVFATPPSALSIVI